MEHITQYVDVRLTMNEATRVRDFLLCETLNNPDFYEAKDRAAFARFAAKIDAAIETTNTQPRGVRGRRLPAAYKPGEICQSCDVPHEECGHMRPESPLTDSN